MEKSANQKWKESGSTLTFKEWIERENKKNEAESIVNFNSDDVLVLEEEKQETFVNADADNIINKTINQIQDVRVEEDKSKLFGLDKRILFFSTFLIVGSLGFYFYKRYKENRG